MATRPVFVPDYAQPPFVKEVMVDFTWYSGFAKSQAQKSISSLHLEAKRQGIEPILEISSKSTQRLGMDLSAFNLMIKVEGHQGMSVECAFQGSKVFEGGGPFSDLYTVSSREAKKDDRIRNSGDLIRFNFLGEDFPTKPLTAFYDWLYLKALSQNGTLASQLLRYNGFTDIAFNPEKSINCQARSAALFVALSQIGEIDEIVKDKRYYLELITQKSKPTVTRQKPGQLSLPFNQDDAKTN
jgi:hypothetical protein